MPGQRTAAFNAIVDLDGQPIAAVGDMDILDAITPEIVKHWLPTLLGAKMVCIDANFSPEVIETVCNYCSSNKIPGSTITVFVGWLNGNIHTLVITVWFQPTSIEKCTKALPVLGQVDFISPNRNEWLTILKRIIGDKAVNEIETPSQVLASVNNVCD